MGKIVKFTVVDAAGSGLSGQKVSAGSYEMTTASNGMAQALLDDGNTVIKVNGATAYEGPVANLQAMEVFIAAGERRR